MAKKKIFAGPSIRRLPSYLNIIKLAAERGEANISGTNIADELQLEAIQVRKDLALTGAVGTPKRGYSVKELIFSIERFLGWNIQTTAVLIGAGCLGAALLGYEGFGKHGLTISLALDNAKEKVGSMIHGVPICHIDDAEKLIIQENIKVAILAVPSEKAQSISDVLVRAGIKGIWNFTNTKITTPDDVCVWKEDLSSGYAMLSYMMSSN